MFPAFISGVERRTIKSDYEQGIRSPEAQRVTLVYRVYKASAPSVKDPVYDNVEDREEEPEDKKVPGTPCYQQIVNMRTIKEYAVGFVEVGDCIFWFSTSLDLNEPVEGDAMVPGSFYIEDALGNTWIPKLQEAERKKQNLLLLEGSLQVGQPLMCMVKPDARNT